MQVWSSNLISAIVTDSRANPFSYNWLYEQGAIDRADRVPLENRVRCVYMLKDPLRQCTKPSAGRLMCPEHQHERDVFSKATTVLLLIKRLSTAPDRYVKYRGDGENLMADRNISFILEDRRQATDFVASCLFGDSPTQLESESESEWESEADAEADSEAGDPTYVPYRR